MPQASDEMRDLMKQYFGNGIDDRGPTEFLFSHGYLEKAGYWTKPTPSHSVTDYEWDCLNFLCEEWDYAYSFEGLSNHTEVI